MLVVWAAEGLDPLQMLFYLGHHSPEGTSSLDKYFPQSYLVSCLQKALKDPHPMIFIAYSLVWVGPCDLLLKDESEKSARMLLSWLNYESCDFHLAGLSPLGLLHVPFDETSCHAGEAHLAMVCGQPPATSPLGSETLCPPLMKMECCQ